MPMHAMPVMLGVLAILAIAYRYYSAFLAARVAALDDSVETPAYRFRDGHNFDPTNKWVLFGHHFAAISGAGPLIGPVLAIQFGYLPGLIWLVVGVCLAGAVQDMTVLALSTQRDGLSLAGLARREIGRPAGIAATIAILYIIIIALAGLGIVVVKALGGEEIPLKAGTVLVYPPKAELGMSMHSNEPKVYVVPPETTYKFGEIGRAVDGLPRVVPRWRFPGTPGSSRIPEGPAGCFPRRHAGWCRGRPGAPSRSPARSPSPSLSAGTCTACARGRSIEASIIGAVAVLGATVLGALRARLGSGAVFLPFPQRHGLRPGGLRIRRGRAAGLAAPLPARLSVQLPQDRHDRSSGPGRDRRQSQARGPADQPALRLRRRALLRRPDLPLCVHLHHVRGNLRVPRPGVVGHDTQDGQPAEPHPDDRLRRDADGGPGGSGRPDRRGRAAQLDVLRHQHRPRQAAGLHGEESRFCPVPQGLGVRP